MSRIVSVSDRQLRPAVATHVAVRAGRAELGEDPFPVHRVEMDIVLQPHAGDFDDAVRNTARAIARVPGVGFAIESFLGERIHETLAGDAAPIVVKVIGDPKKATRVTKKIFGFYGFSVRSDYYSGGGASGSW